MVDRELPDQLHSYGTPSVAVTTTPHFFLYGELIKSKQTFLLLYTTFFAYLITAWTSGFDLTIFMWVNVGVFFAVSGSTLSNALSIIY